VPAQTGCGHAPDVVVPAQTTPVARVNLPDSKGIFKTSAYPHIP
jgi:hypothetical protein